MIIANIETGREILDIAHFAGGHFARQLRFPLRPEEERRDGAKQRGADHHGDQLPLLALVDAHRLAHVIGHERVVGIDGRAQLWRRRHGGRCGDGLQIWRRVDGGHAGWLGGGLLDQLIHSLPQVRVHLGRFAQYERKDVMARRCFGQQHVGIGTGFEAGAFKLGDLLRRERVIQIFRGGVRVEVGITVVEVAAGAGQQLGGREPQPTNRVA